MENPDLTQLGEDDRLVFHTTLLRWDALYSAIEPMYSFQYDTYNGI